ncbi:concanavalin A-like lectin/glucanase domain-containing protein [Crassisporium funariophilum]|nr:concanavalin A-like lectin/glucanase domain-containing protein [Crassisporium funariophilum]
MLSTAIPLFLLLSAVLDAGVAQPNTTGDCVGTLVIPGIPGGFTERVFADFSGAKVGDDVAALLSSHGLTISNYPVQSVPIPHDFVRQNVVTGAGTLDLKVDAFSRDTVASSEILTQDLFKYASVRTVMKSSSVPGIVEGNFFYLNDTQEIDWEILTSTVSNSTACVEAGIWATNRALVPGGPSTHKTIPFTFDPAADFHEYRVDWAANATTFYIDGVLKATHTTNIPTAAGRWIWNAWSSGDPCWSNGPPQANSVTQIQSIEIFKGYQETVNGPTCDVRFRYTTSCDRS